MISRLCRGFALVATLVAFALLTVACQKVPLLAPSGSTITLTALATALPANGSTDIIAQVIEAGGTPPHSGTLITFTTNLGTVQPSEAETDISGRVTVKYVAGTGSGTATIVAISGGVSASGTNAIKIAVGAAAVGAVRVDANPSVIPASGGTATITATAFDVNGNLLTGVPISFTTDAGAVSPAVANTDANGKAQTTLTTTKASTVTASAGLTSTTGGTGSTTTAPQTATVKVNVNVAPSITVGAPSPATPAVGQSVTFPLTYGADANGSPVQSVTVDFGDGSKPTVFTGKPASVSHTYNAIGSYSMRATVVDSQGDTSSASSSVSVGALGTVTVGTPTPSAPAVGQAVSFQLTFADTAGTIQRISVDYGDGTAAVSYAGKPTSINHTYTTVGTFAIRVTAFDAFGNTSIGGTSISVGVLGTVTVGTPAPSAPTVGQAVSFPLTFSDTAGSIQRISVDYGDGTAAVSYAGKPSSVNHTYTTGGTFAIRVTAFDAFGNTSVGGTSVLISARPQPTVSITTTTTNPTAGTDITFTASVAPATGSGTNIASVSVDFGDSTTPTSLGAVSGSIAIHHVFALAGTYTVVLTATDTNGGVGTATTTVFVQAATPLGVTINASANTGVVTTIETFTATVTGLGNAVVTQYLWQFGNADPPQTTTTNQTTHSYLHGAITYTVRVDITTSDGRTTFNTVSITP